MALNSRFHAVLEMQLLETDIISTLLAVLAALLFFFKTPEKKSDFKAQLGYI